METVKVTATVEMEVEITEEHQRHEDHAHDLLDGFFSTYPSWLDGSAISGKPQIKNLDVKQP